MQNRIRARAWEIYEYCRDTGLHLIFDRGEIRERTPQDDWLEAEAQVKNEIEIEKNQTSNQLSQG